MLTEAREEKYVKSGGSSCPGCGSSKITAGDIEADGAQAYCNVTCNQCGATWQDLFKLVGIDNFSAGDKIISNEV